VPRIEIVIDPATPAATASATPVGGRKLFTNRNTLPPTAWVANAGMSARACDRASILPVYR